MVVIILTVNFEYVSGWDVQALTAQQALIPDQHSRHIEGLLVIGLIPAIDNLTTPNENISGYHRQTSRREEKSGKAGATHRSVEYGRNEVIADALHLVLGLIRLVQFFWLCEARA